jgi:hypothetical protein
MPNVLCRMVISVSVLLGSYWLPNAGVDKNPVQSNASRFL